MSKFLSEIEKQVAVGIKTLTPIDNIYDRMLGINFVAKMAKKFKVQKPVAKQIIENDLDFIFANETQTVVWTLCDGNIGSRSTLDTLSQAASKVCGYTVTNNLASQYRGQYRDVNNLQEDCRTNKTQFKRDMRRTDYN